MTESTNLSRMSSSSRNSIISSTSNVPFTPKRSLSTQSSASSTSGASSYHTANTEPKLISRANMPVLLNTTHKKYKAPISVESRPKHKVAKSASLAPIPSTPTKGRERTLSRPKTPNTPRSRAGAESPFLVPTSEMDVSNVDPEQVLVDYQSVEPGDVSGEIDEAWLRAANLDHGKHDKVMVSIRVRPTQAVSAWIPTPSTNSIKLDPNYAKNATNATPGSSQLDFNFDAVLTGTPNKPIYTTVGRSHVQAAMEGYNAVIFAYGQTASGKTFTLTGNEEEPGIIPRAMRDVFGFIRRTPAREYLLRCSYLEIYNETVIDLLAPPVMAKANPVQILGGGGASEVMLSPLREEVVTSLKGVHDVLKRGEGNRRTACTDWNERSSRSHSVFRLVVESRERGNPDDDDDDYEVHSTPANPMNGRHTPGLSGRHTPGLNGRQTPGPGPKLQARGGRSVQTSVLSLIDLAGSEKATSDKERTREGKYINTSLLTLGTVISTLADNASKTNPVHVPYRNSKLTRMLQPSLSGNARISVICTINPDVNAIAESTSTLLFARRIKSVKLDAKKKEVVDTDALIERYRKEIEELKKRLEEKEREMDAPVTSRRLSARDKLDESNAVRDLNSRIKQLTKLILTSNSVDENRDGDSGPSSPQKIDFNMTPYQLQQELLAARYQLDTQATQILSLEAALQARPPIPTSAPEEEKDRLITDQAKTIRELEIVIGGYEQNLGEPLRKVKEDVEKEFEDKLAEEKTKREEKERWAEELAKALQKEKQARIKLEEERRALAAFVSKFDALGLGLAPPSKLRFPMPTPGGAMSAYGRRQSRSSTGSSTRLPSISDATLKEEFCISEDFTGMSDMSSPMRLDKHYVDAQPSLLDQDMPDSTVDMSFDELEVERELLADDPNASLYIPVSGLKGIFPESKLKPREVLGDKENVLPSTRA